MAELRWDDLRVLFALRDSGSLARAATQLGVNKTTVSRRLDALEDALGVTLVRRDARGYALTDEAQAAIETAESMNRLVEDLQQRISGRDDAPAGEVIVTSPAFFAQKILIPALPALREKYPDLEVLMATTDKLLDLGKREADLAIRNVAPPNPDLVIRRAGGVGMGLYASVDYIARRGRPRSRDDLRSHHMVGHQDRNTYVHGFEWLNDAQISVAFRASDLHAIYDAIATGLGIGIVPCIVGDGDERVVRLDEVQPPAIEEILLAAQPEVRTQARIRIVADWILSRFEDEADYLAGR